MAGVIGLRGPDIEKRQALRGYKVVFEDADRPFVRPHTGLPVLALDPDGQPEVSRHVFGFTKKFSSFNARADKLESSKMWSKLFGKTGHHGIAPVSYILEWGDIGAGKQPFRIERRDGSAMCVPALVGGYWEAPGTKAFSLVTIEPNQFVATFHGRMIGQLGDEQLDAWLHPDQTGSDGLWECLQAPANDELVAYPLAANVGSARFDDQTAMESVGPAISWDQLKGRPLPDGQATLGV